MWKLILLPIFLCAGITLTIIYLSQGTEEIRDGPGWQVVLEQGILEESSKIYRWQTQSRIDKTAHIDNPVLSDVISDRERVWKFIPSSAFLMGWSIDYVNPILLFLGKEFFMLTLRSNVFR